jgi:ABC-2 type transport system permease protein
MSATAVPAGKVAVAELPDAPDPGMVATIRSEWIKLRSAPGMRRNLILGTVLGVAMSGLVSLVVGATFAEWPIAEQLVFDPILYSLSGLIVSLIFFVVVGVRTVTSEYGSGMIDLTLTATPHRGRILGAKAIVVTVVMWVFGAITVTMMLVIGQVIFAANDLATVGFGDRDMWRALLLIALLNPTFPVIGVAAGFMLRSTAAALSGVLALFFVPSMFGGLFPRWWQENVLSLFPGPAVDAVSIGHLQDSAMYAAPALGMVITVVWLAGSLAAAAIVLDRRDA